MNTRRGLRDVDTSGRTALARDSSALESTNFLEDTQGIQVAELENQLQESRGQPLSRSLPPVVERIRALTGAHGAAIAVRDEWGVICRASSGNAPPIGSRLRSDSALTRECFEVGHVVVCQDATQDSRVEASIAKALHLGSAVVVPIRAKTEVLGIIEVLSSGPNAFDSTHVARLQSISELLAPFLAAAKPPQDNQATPKRRWFASLGAVLSF